MPHQAKTVIFGLKMGKGENGKHPEIEHDNIYTYMPTQHSC